MRDGQRSRGRAFCVAFGSAGAWTLVAAAICVTTVACEESAAAPSSLSGAILFERHCAACHGSDGKGDGPVAPALRRRPLDLTRIQQRNQGRFDAGEVMAVIDGRRSVAEHGPREMPVWGAVFEEGLRGREAPYPGITALAQTRALTDYLRSIQVTATDPGSESGLH